MTVSVILGLFIVLGLGMASLTSGAFFFLFGSPRITLLKSKKGSNGFAFGFKWDSVREPVKFNRVQLRLFNPYGSPTQVAVSQEFDLKGETFAEDFDMGPAFDNLIHADGLEKGLVQVELTSSKDGVTFQKEMKGEKFLRLKNASQQSAEDYNKKNTKSASKPLFTLPKRDFISGPLAGGKKALKIASNPEFAGEFSAGGGAGEAAVENFSISKVWIEPGCIVCDACEDIYPEVFEVTADSCVIRSGAPLDNGLLVLEAAEACPVEVIKFNK
jgi:ferredoxin